MVKQDEEQKPGVFRTNGSSTPGELFPCIHSRRLWVQSLPMLACSPRCPQVLLLPGDSELPLVVSVIEGSVCPAMNW